MTSFTSGCQKRSQLGVIYRHEDGTNLIVGCDGEWSDPPGLDHASDALCDTENGYEICSDFDQLRRLKLSVYDCGHWANPDTIYVTAIGSDNLLLGCGNVDNHDGIPVTLNNRVWPFSLALDAWELEEDSESLSTSSWRSDFESPVFDQYGLYGSVYKTNDTGGGIMCCKQIRLGPPEHGVDDVIQILLEMIAFVMMFFLFSLCVFKSIQCIAQCMRNRLTCCRGRCRFNGVIHLFGRWSFPITRNGYKIWKRKREIDRIKCKTFAQFQRERGTNDDDMENGDVITDGSAMCVICLEDYEQDSMVIHLRCAHHFHKECGLPWLIEHQDCPICRQNFKTAEDQHVYGEGVEMKKVGLQSVNIPDAQHS